MGDPDLGGGKDDLDLDLDLVRDEERLGTGNTL